MTSYDPHAGMQRAPSQVVKGGDDRWHVLCGHCSAAELPVIVSMRRWQTAVHTAVWHTRICPSPTRHWRPERTRA